MEVNKTELNIKSIVKNIINTKEGEDLLLALETKYNTTPSYTVGDTHETAYKEGQRSVVLFLLSCLIPDQQ